MNDKITVLYTKRKWNIGSWLIRYGLPRSRLHIATTSHCLIVDGDYVIEATMRHGVRRVLREESLKGQTIVDAVSYSVVDAQKALEWARAQVGSGYDFKGAFGLVLNPSRDWTEDDSWFCYELAAAVLKQAGRDIFRSAGHITGTMLMAIKP